MIESFLRAFYRGVRPELIAGQLYSEYHRIHCLAVHEWLERNEGWRPQP